jgi:hypothetical protein
MKMGFGRAIWAVLLVFAGTLTALTQTTEMPPPDQSAATTPATQAAEPPAQTTEPAMPAYEPKFPGDPARSESEAMALGYMRTVLRAQRDYKKKHNNYATSLAALVHTGSFTSRMVQTDRGDYTVGFKSRKDGFELTMTPKEMAPERRSFYATDDGKIHADDERAADGTSPTVS